MRKEISEKITIAWRSTQDFDIGKHQDICEARTLFGGKGCMLGQTHWKGIANSQVTLTSSHTGLRSRQDSNLRGETPMDFQSIALTTRPRLHDEIAPYKSKQLCLILVFTKPNYVLEGLNHMLEHVFAVVVSYFSMSFQ